MVVGGFGGLRYWWPLIASPFDKAARCIELQHNDYLRSSISGAIEFGIMK